MANDKAFKVKNTLELAGYNTSIASTAVDVFIYDTSKDSDGGAWRKRTQHTSWYNETLNTATRGSRREFPAVAVIVAEATKVTIYDGDDPALPMWMVVDGGSDRFFNTAGGGAITSIAIKNGWLVGTTSTRGYSRLNFISEEAYIGLGAVTYKISAPIAVFRNATVFPTYTITGSVFSIASGVANDVAMTVLSDAPIDPATGLPVPTIAVATNGGVSVIADSGAVYDSSSTLAFGHVAFDDQGGVWAARNTSTYILIYGSVSDYISGDGWGDNIARSDASTAGGFDLLSGGTSGVLFADNTLALGGTTSVQNSKAGALLRQLDYTDQSKGMSALLTSTYNTGWMNGDIKGAFLSSTDTASLVGGVNIITDTSMYPLALSTGNIHTNTSANLVAGNFYRVQFQVQWSADAAGQVAVYATTTGLPYLAINADPGNTTTLDYIARAEDSGYVFGINASGMTAGTATIVSPSVSVADADRSVNNNGLIVNGTVTRSPVATGAELVAYSGFSASNYLEQPYNSALDFGTGDFCVMGWSKNHQSYDTFLVRSDGVTQTTEFILQTSANKADCRYYIGGGGYVASNVYPDTTGTWFHQCFFRSNGTLYMYVNGVLKFSALRESSLTQTGATLQIGKAANVATTIGEDPFQGSLALWRISATAPTAEQIKKIYDDEKVLFQENAAATLYGTSDAVTALAHDEDTGLLHVGTSAGRSVFQGLRRVSNTTTAVGTAISAANGMIAEE